MVGIVLTVFAVVLGIDKYFWKLISTAKVLTRACVAARVNLEAVFFSSYLDHKTGVMDSWKLGIRIAT